jgi:non-heme chloroperoxidase
MGNQTDQRRPGARIRALAAGTLAFSVLVGAMGACGGAPSPAREPSVRAASAATDRRVPPTTPIRVKTPDGLSIAVQQWGNPKGPEILFIHGLLQSHLSWTPQITSRLAKEFRIVTYDLRGHGDSDKPADPKYYGEDRRWADELDAVIKGAGLTRPVLVGWSLGGAVMANYLHAYGDKNIAGAVFVAAVTRFDGALLSPIPPLSAEDLPTRVAAIQAFLSACFAVPPNREDFETMLTFNGMVPREVNVGIRQLSLEGGDDALRALLVPTLVIQGSEDRLVKGAMATRTASLIRGAQTSIYEGVGHAPFYEASERFNAEIEKFVRGAAPAR